MLGLQRLSPADREIVLMTVVITAVFATIGGVVLYAAYQLGDADPLPEVARQRSE